MNLEFCSDLLLVKNETVNGIIGKTHGVRSANKPPINPSINRFIYELEVKAELSLIVDNNSVFFKSIANALLFS